MSQENCEIASNMDLSDWCEATFNEKEIPLCDIIAIMKDEPGRLILQRSRQYPNSYLLWDSECEDVVVATHAFVMKYSSPLQTGNFVPEQYDLPEGMFDYLRKTEPGPMAQISVTYDCRMDEKFVGYLQFLEDWILRQANFDPGKRKRNPWMSPSYVTNNYKYTMTSQLFQSKTAFNCKQDGYTVSYPVHEWIEEHCYPNNPSWIPNPNVVQFYELQEGVLKDMRNTDDSTLRGGDMVKTTFKIVVTNGRETWNMGLIPIQVVRVGKIDRSSMAPFMQLEDHKPVELPRDGDRINLSKRQKLQARQTGPSKEREERSVPPKKRMKRSLADEKENRSKSDAEREPSNISGSCAKLVRKRVQSKCTNFDSSATASNGESSGRSEDLEGDVTPATREEAREMEDDMYMSSELSEEGQDEERVARRDHESTTKSGRKTNLFPGAAETLPADVTQLLREVFSGGSPRSSPDKRAALKSGAAERGQRRSTRKRK